MPVFKLASKINPQEQLTKDIDQKNTDIKKNHTKIVRKLDEIKKIEKENKILELEKQILKIRRWDVETQWLAGNTFISLFGSGTRVC